MSVNIKLFKRGIEASFSCDLWYYRHLLQPFFIFYFSNECSLVFINNTTKLFEKQFCMSLLISVGKYFLHLSTIFFNRIHQK